MPERHDAIVIGSGPNGLAAAIAVAQAGRSVLVLEAEETIGGGCRSAALTLPGFVHDICSAIHPLAAASPFFRTLPLARHGLDLLQPPVPLAHPLDDGSAAVLERSMDATARGLGVDGGAWARLFRPFVADADRLIAGVLGPLRFPTAPLLMVRFGFVAIRSARSVVDATFRGAPARALFGGMAAHSFLRLDQMPSAAFGLMLATLGQSVGWPVARGGSQRIVDALVRHLGTLGAEVETHRRVAAIDELPPSRAVIADVTPRQLLAIAGDRLPAGYRRALTRYRYGPGVFKVDYALDGAVPWRAEACRRAGTVHVGGTFEEIAASEAAIHRGEAPERPFVLVGQQSLFDPTRAPEGKHTIWAYCHVPNGYSADMTARIDAQIERFAPGFRDRILARGVMGPAQVETRNSNCVGGDINGGIQDLGQLFTRPVARLDPYATPARGLYLCSSSTPPGGGVHGMCGYFAARSVLRNTLAR